MKEKDFYNFNKIQKNFSYYLDIKKEIQNKILNNYSAHKEKIIVKVQSEEIEMNLGLFLLNLILIQPYFSFLIEDIEITKNDLFLEKNITQDLLKNALNKILKKFSPENLSDYDQVRREIFNILNELSDLSAEINILSGSSISFHDFLKLSNEDKKFKDIIYKKIPYGLEFDEIEKRFDKTGKELIDYFKEKEDADLHPFVTSETGINKKQLIQALSIVGLKPEIDGSVIPVAIDENYLVGLSNIENYFISCKGARKALITNKNMVRKSGYLTRKLSLSILDRYTDADFEDCGTTHFVEYNVENKKRLAQIEGRSYYLLDDSKKKVSNILYTVKEDDTFLIGKIIGLRSPVTCCGKDVCATCYGKRLAKINKKVNTGLIAILKLTEPLTQKLLSAKHLLSTNIDKVNWGEKFKDIFMINMDSIYFNETDSSISFDFPTEYDEDEDMFFINEFKISTGTKKTIVYESPVELFINSKLLKIKDDEEKITINSKQIEDDFIFKYQAKNNELSKSLQQILDLIETSSHLGITDYNIFINKFNDLLIENELDYINSVHIEMITSILIRDEKTGKRLDFSKKNLNNYVINRVSKSVMDAPLSVSLAFERLNDQLMDLKTYEKNEVSMMDSLFK